jgi:hypothetical protein
MPLKLKNHEHTHSDNRNRCEKSFYWMVNFAFTVSEWLAEWLAEAWPWPDSNWIIPGLIQVDG